MEWLLSALKSLDWRVLAGLALSMLGVLLCAAVLRAFLHRRRWFRDYAQACHLMRGNRIERAEEGFQRAAREAYGMRHTAALAGIGSCRVYQGRYAEAVALLEPLLERPLPRSMEMEDVVLRGHLALCLAMLGDTPGAKRWLGEACARFGGMVTFLVLPEIAILCREGRLSAALLRMEECWPVVMADGLACRRLRLFRAFAQKKVDPERNDAGPVLMTLLSLAPFPAEELAFCREHWPVLADFMQLGEDMVARREEDRARRQAEWEASRAAPPKRDDTPG